jgi:hypothetical protein
MKTAFKISKIFVLTIALFTLTSSYMLQYITPMQSLWANYWILSWYLTVKAVKHYKIYKRHYNNKHNKKII